MRLGRDTWPKYCPALHTADLTERQVHMEKKSHFYATTPREMSLRSATFDPRQRSCARLGSNTGDSKSISLRPASLLSLYCTPQRMFTIPTLSHERLSQFKALADVLTSILTPPQMLHSSEADRETCPSKTADDWFQLGLIGARFQMLN